MKTYHGTRTENGVSVVVEENGKFNYPLNPRLDLRNHSPAGFEFGYYGSGPAQLSLAILADALGDDESAQNLYQQYKFDFVSRLEGDRWTISQESIQEWAMAQTKRD